MESRHALGFSARSQNEPYIQLGGPKRSADDLIVDILCDAGKVAGFVMGGILETVQAKNVPWSADVQTSKETELDNDTAPAFGMTPSNSWEQALLQQIESASDAPNASPWRIVAPGCSQLPCEPVRKLASF